MSARSQTTLLAGLVGLLVAVSGCGDDPTGPSRDPIIWNIPDEDSFEAAADGAIPGDTLEVSSVFVPLPALTKTVTFDSDQTPLVIRGRRGFPVLTIGSDDPILRFVSPRTGTRISGMAFSGGSVALTIEGGTMAIDDCNFIDGTVQILGSGGGTRVDVSETVMRDAAAFAIVMQSGASVIAVNNTINEAGDCGILITSNSRGEVNNCIISNSVNFGIACTDGGSLVTTSGCNDIYMSGMAMYQNCGPGVDDFALDPEFCGPPTDLTIQTTSPCAPANSGDCGLIGALIDLCDPVIP